MLFLTLLEHALRAYFLVTVVHAQEQHIVSIVNNCGKGYPVLGGLDGRQFYPTSEPVVFVGPALGLFSYLQYTDDDGNNVCEQNGEGCTTIEASLNSNGSSADISLVPPHAFSVTTGFGYYDGCDGAGLDCTNADCPGAKKHNSSQGWLPISCSAANVSLGITFCD
ncbi:glycopeptide [Rhodofomes roseus]|uniref:Glycopeptide n=1 Tax=Rhodofomes roseus TaxID=34475 RepID=A0ABQ8K0E3_9APHY|nr:glycopeptide [Rhodofomes roseus]KAH9830061.1 glycopeptide [Rhodofomes roseus]